MLTKEVLYHRSKLAKCIKYRDYETAIYISLYISKSNPEYKLLAAILLYENKEYSRSIEMLGENNDVTRLYYRALNFKARKNTKEAISTLSVIIDGKAKQDVVNDPLIQSYCLSLDDTEFYDSLMGELLIIKGKCHSGIEKYKKSYLKDPLLVPCYGLHDENICIASSRHFEKDIIMKLYVDLNKMKMQKTGNSFIEIPKSTAELKQHFPLVEEYFNNSPGYGSYFLSRLASSISKYSVAGAGNEIFELLRQRDMHFIRELDVYSTDLWVSKDFNLLGLLAKDLVLSAPTHHITWTVLGNYYSIAGMPKESYMCLMKSLSCLETHNAYTLLGFECNAKSQYQEAQSFFRSSLCMLENNDRAYFGMGISFSELSKKTSAETYFSKALTLNPKNISMQALVVRFYVKNRGDEISLQKIKESLGIEFKSHLDIVNYIENNTGKFKEMEELIILEYCELLVRFGRRDLARDILGCVNCRTSTYFAKRNIIENSD